MIPVLPHPTGIWMIADARLDAKCSRTALCASRCGSRSRSLFSMSATVDWKNCPGLSCSARLYSSFSGSKIRPLVVAVVVARVPDRFQLPFRIPAPERLRRNVQVFRGLLDCEVVLVEVSILHAQHYTTSYNHVHCCRAEVEHRDAASRNNPSANNAMRLFRPRRPTAIASGPQRDAASLSDFVHRMRVEDRRPGRFMYEWTEPVRRPAATAPVDGYGRGSHRLRWDCRAETRQRLGRRRPDRPEVGSAAESGAGAVDGRHASRSG